MSKIIHRLSERDQVRVFVGQAQDSGLVAVDSMARGEYMEASGAIERAQMLLETAAASLIVLEMRRREMEAET